MFPSLAEYPQWFVSLCMLLAGALLLWVLFKLATFALKALIVLLVVIGIGIGAWYLLK
jgi:hypothetical protein